MLTKKGVALTFYAFYVASKVGKTGLTVTVDVYEQTTGTPIVSGGSATEIGGGLYYYTLASGSVDASGAYIAVFKTADSSVDQQHIPALWVTDTELLNLDAAVSSRLPTASYTAAPAAGTVADAILDDEEVSAGVTVRQALAAAGSAADPLLNAVPGSYAEDTGGYALGRLLAISDAAVWSPVVADNEMTLVDAVQGGLRPGQQLTWVDASGVAVDLTGAILHGVIRSRATGSARVIAGTLSVTDAMGGVFTWEYAAADVADAGLFDVQFVASYSSGLTPAKTFVSVWTVRESLEVPN